MKEEHECVLTEVEKSYRNYWMQGSFDLTFFHCYHSTAFDASAVIVCYDTIWQSYDQDWCFWLLLSDWAIDVGYCW